MISATVLRSEKTLHIARKRACRAKCNSIIVHKFIDYAECKSLVKPALKLCRIIFINDFIPLCLSIFNFVCIFTLISLARGNKSSDCLFSVGNNSLGIHFISVKRANVDTQNLSFLIKKPL